MSGDLIVVGSCNTPYVYQTDIDQCILTCYTRFPNKEDFKKLNECVFACGFLGSALTTCMNLFERTIVKSGSWNQESLGSNNLKPDLFSDIQKTFSYSTKLISS